MLRVQLSFWNDLIYSILEKDMCWVIHLRTLTEGIRILIRWKTWQSYYYSPLFYCTGCYFPTIDENGVIGRYKLSTCLLRFFRTIFSSTLQLMLICFVNLEAIFRLIWSRFLIFRERKIKLFSTTLKLIEEKTKWASIKDWYKIWATSSVCVAVPIKNTYMCL